MKVISESHFTEGFEVSKLILKFTKLVAEFCDNVAQSVYRTEHARTKFQNNIFFRQLE